MNKILIGICLASFSSLSFAECRSVLVYGQHKDICDSSKIESSNNQNTIEYTEVPQASKRPISKQKSETKKLASLEHSINKAHANQSSYEPTHTQLDQVRQLLEYANNQGCRWGGKYEKPLLICPEDSL